MAGKNYQATEEEIGEDGDEDRLIFDYTLAEEELDQENAPETDYQVDSGYYGGYD